MMVASTRNNGVAGAVAEAADDLDIDAEHAARPKRRRKAAEGAEPDVELIGRAADHLRSLETKPAATSKPIVIPKLDIHVMRVRLVGDAPLIVHRFSEKAKKQMLDKQMGVASEGRAFKDPQQDFEESLYKLPGDKFGFPAIAFKNAAVTACTSLGKAVTKVAARQAFHVVGDMVEIVGTPTMREDTVRVGQGTADIRYRGEFREWSCELTIRYNARVLSDEQIINLLNVAGFAVGIGEWRPERDGQFGLFHVE